MASLKEEREKHRVEKELKNISRYIKLNPNDAAGYLIRAGIYEILKKHELTLSDLKKVISIDKNNSIAYHDIGKIYLEQNRFDIALDNLNKAIEINPNQALFYNTRGLYYDKNEKYEEAIKDLNKAISLDSSLDVAYFNLGLCFFSLRKYDVSLENYNKAASLNSNDADIYYNRGLCFLTLEKYEMALNDFKSAIKLDGNYVKAYSDLGCCYIKFKKYELALFNFNKALKLDRKYAIAYINLGACYYEKKSYELAINNFTKAFDFSEKLIDKKNCCLYISDVFVSAKKYEYAKKYVEKAFEYADLKELQHKDIYLERIDSAEELDKRNKELEEKNKQLEIEIQEKEKAYKIAHEKEKEMLSFFTHTMRNALATAPESLRQAIRLLGSADYEKNQNHYEAINEITALFSTITLTDCLIDTFKQSIYDTEEFKRAWQQDNTGDASPEWFIAAALRQSLNRIIFMEDATGLRKLINNQGALIRPTRKAFIEQVLPLDTNQRDVEKFYHWLQSITMLEVNIEKSAVQFGANQIKFSLMFAISSELILNALKYWSGTGKIQIAWHIEPEFYIFSVKNACKANASSQLAGTHKGLAFINRLIELLGEQAQFNCTANEYAFTAELKLHKTLLEGE